MADACSPIRPERHQDDDCIFMYIFILEVGNGDGQLRRHFEFVRYVAMVAEWIR